MGDYREGFVGIDVAKMKNAIAIAEGERGGEVRYLGEMDASDASMVRLVKRIAAKYDRIHFCYEDLSPSAAHRPGEALQARAGIAQGPRDRLEGTDPIDGAVPRAQRARQEDDDRLLRDCPRARRLHVVRGPGGAARRLIISALEKEQGH